MGIQLIQLTADAILFMNTLCKSITLEGERKKHPSSTSISAVTNLGREKSGLSIKTKSLWEKISTKETWERVYSAISSRNCRKCKHKYR